MPRIRNHENIFVIGPCGVGKSFLAAALAQKACRDRYSALYLRAAALSREPALTRADGSLRHFLARLSRIDVLVIDDWAMAPLSESERREVWEICEDRYQARSTILTSQLPVSRWHEQIGDPTIADGILDRLVHNAHRIEMRGESMRKKLNPPPEENKRVNLFYGAAAPFPCTPKPRPSSSASLRTISVDEAEHFRHNHHASVASLRLLFSFTPERRSASLRNQRSPSPEYPRSSDAMDAGRVGAVAGPGNVHRRFCRSYFWLRKRFS